MSRIAEVFDSLQGEGALIAYMMGGDPDIDTSRMVIGALVEGGADIIEVGVPFSDPIADGRSIQAAGNRALAAGVTPAAVFGLVAEAKQMYRVPIVIMTYYNVLFSRGLAGFMKSAAKARVDGLVVPDLPLDESADYSRLARRMGLDTILLAAPTTPPDRMRSLMRNSTGFLYLVSLLGVTGARPSVGSETLALVSSAKRQTSGRIPLAVGFGISKPSHVRSIIDAGADAVIVGSSIVDRVASDRPKEDMLDEVTRYVRSLKTATRRRRTEGLSPSHRGGP